MLEDRLTTALTGPLAALGMDLEAVEVTPAGKRRVLRIAVDKDGGVTLDDVADATREIGRVLDGPGDPGEPGDDLMGEQPYTLEVTSRGVDRPLTLPRHWRRNQDRLVKVSLAAGGTVTGRVTTSDETGATLDVQGRERRVGWDDVERALVQVEFSRRAVSGGPPDDPADDPADDPTDDAEHDTADEPEED